VIDTSRKANQGQQLPTVKLPMEKHFFGWVPHEFSPENKEMRVILAQAMLKFLEVDEKKCLNIITGDESRFDWFTSSAFQRQTIDTQTETIPKSVIRTSKSMISVFFSLQGFLVAKNLPKGRTFDSDSLIVNILREMEAPIQEDHSVKKLKGVIIHMDNTRLHTSKRMLSKIERLEPRRMPHPPYRRITSSSLDLSARFSRDIPKSSFVPQIFILIRDIIWAVESILSCHIPQAAFLQTATLSFTNARQMQSNMESGART
jgi:hypothetical protein